MFKDKLFIVIPNVHQWYMGKHNVMLFSIKKEKKYWNVLQSRLMVTTARRELEGRMGMGVTLDGYRTSF